MNLATSVIILAIIVGFPSSIVAGNDAQELPNLRGSVSTPAKCHSVGTYGTKFVMNMDHLAPRRNIVCYFPDTETEETFPLLSFAHGRGGGGLLVTAYYPMMEQLASSGYVVCAYTQCHEWCPHKWPMPQLDALTTAREIKIIDIDPDLLSELSSMTPLTDPQDSSMTINIEDGIVDVDLDFDLPDLPDIDASIEPLPINEELSTGVFGHSAGGIETLMSAYNRTVSNYTIGAAVLYDGASPKDMVFNADLERVEESIPIFLAASTIKDSWGTPPQCEAFTKPTADTLAKNDPGRPLLVACITNMDHQDNVISLLRWKPTLLAVPYIAAFFGHTLDPSNQCVAEYKDILNEQLEQASSYYENYKNSLFET